VPQMVLDKKLVKVSSSSKKEQKKAGKLMSLCRTVDYE